MNVKPKVLLICGDPVGGIRRHVHTIIEGAVKSGIDVYYSHSTVCTDNTFEKDMEKLSGSLSGICPLIIYKKPGLQDIKNICSLISFCRKNGINVVHGHGAKGGLYARILKLFCNVKSAYTPHGGVLHSAFSPRADMLYVSIERMVRFLTDLLIFESEYSKLRYDIKIGKAKCPEVVNYNGVSLENITRTNDIPLCLLNKTEDYENIGVFGRIHHMKGQDTAVKALALMPDKYRLHLFGSGCYDELKTTCADLGLSDRVFFHGEIMNPEEVMQYIDIVLIPSTFESFSYVAAEAIMMGVPTVASSVGGLKEVLDNDCGILVEKLEPKYFAEAIIRMTDDENFRKQCVKNGLERYSLMF